MRHAPTALLRRCRQLALVVALGAGVVACGTTPPAGWAEGGRPTALAPLRWVNGAYVIDIDAEGNVYENGELRFSLDPHGRVYDPDVEPVALLDGEGYVHGPDRRPMGWVGRYEAILPGGEHSWLVLHRGGYLIRYDDDGAGTPMGVWLGCTDPARMQTCMLVSHVVGMDLRTRARRNNPRLGVGFGLGFGIR